MRLNVSAWSIRHPLPAILFAIVTVLLGALSFTKLPITRLPNVDLPVVSVTISQFGAAPAELEAQVTKSVEDAVSGVEGVRHIRSSITDGLSVTTQSSCMARCKPDAEFSGADRSGDRGQTPDQHEGRNQHRYEL